MDTDPTLPPHNQTWETWNGHIDKRTHSSPHVKIATEKYWKVHIKAWTVGHWIHTTSKEDNIWGHIYGDISCRQFLDLFVFNVQCAIYNVHPSCYKYLHTSLHKGSIPQAEWTCVFKIWATSSSKGVIFVFVSVLDSLTDDRSGEVLTDETNLATVTSSYRPPQACPSN